MEAFRCGTTHAFDPPPLILRVCAPSQTRCCWPALTSSWAVYLQMHNAFAIALQIQHAFLIGFFLRDPPIPSAVCWLSNAMTISRGTQSSQLSFASSFLSSFKQSMLSSRTSCAQLACCQSVRRKSFEGERLMITTHYKTDQTPNAVFIQGL